MTQTITHRVYWTTQDIELLPDNGNRYEIIDGELFVTRSPHWNHQNISVNIVTELNIWCRETGLGQVVTTPGIIFGEGDNVIPDIVWISQEKLAQLLDNSGHLTGAPELIIEVLSPGEENQRRDQQAKLKLYSIQGVQEYWIVDPILQQVQVYRRDQALLILIATYLKNDPLNSPLLPGFLGRIDRFFT